MGKTVGSEKAVEVGTKAGYLNLIQQGRRKYGERFSIFLEVDGVHPLVAADERQSIAWLANIEGLLYGLTRRKRQAVRAMDALQVGGGTIASGAGFPLYWASRTYGWIRDSGVFREGEHARFEGMYGGIATGYARGDGAQNRGSTHVELGHAMACGYLADLLPHGEEAPLWRSYAEEVWRDFASVYDFVEDASSFEAIALFCAIRLAELCGEVERFLEDAPARRLCERYLHLLCPVGAMPDYGDSSWGGFWGFWIAAFEGLADLYGDGRFKWAAERMFQYVCAQRFWEDEDAIEHFGSCFGALVDAYLWCNDEILPEEPKGSSVVLYRTDARLYSDEASFRSKIGERVADKLILRNGWGKEATYLALNLMGIGEHGHGDASALVTLVSGGSVLLHDTSYIQRQLEYHNLFYVQDLRDEFLQPSWPHDPARHTYKPSVAYLYDLSKAILAAVQSNRHFGYPVDHRRMILFDKDRGIVAVHDAAEVHRGEYEMGPIYHVQRVVEEGPGFFDTRQETLQHHYGPYWNNRPYGLLVAFPLPSGTVSRKTQNHAPAPFKYIGYRKAGLPDPFIDSFDGRVCLYQSAVVNVGDDVRFLSLLIPHEEERSGGALAGKSPLLFWEGGSSLVRIDEEERTLLIGFRGEVDIQHERVTTDAEMIYVVEGEEQYIAFRKASRIIHQGKTIFQSLALEGRRDPTQFVRIPQVLNGDLVIEDRTVWGTLYPDEEAEAPYDRLIKVDLFTGRKPARVWVKDKAGPIEYNDRAGCCTLKVQGETRFEIIFS